MFFFLPRSLIFLVLFLGEKKKEKKEKKENVCNRNNLLAFCQVLKRRVVFRVIFSFFFNFFFFPLIQSVNAITANRTTLLYLFNKANKQRERKYIYLGIIYTYISR